MLYDHLEPLDNKETEAYIVHRLKKAGNIEGNIFTKDAIDEIYAYSKGVPRLINLACHNSLISGIVYEAKTITKEIAREAINELLHNKILVRSTAGNLSCV